MAALVAEPLSAAEPATQLPAPATAAAITAATPAANLFGQLMTTLATVGLPSNGSSPPSAGNAPKSTPVAHATADPGTRRAGRSGTQSPRAANQNAVTSGRPRNGRAPSRSDVPPSPPPAVDASAVAPLVASPPESAPRDTAPARSDTAARIGAIRPGDASSVAPGSAETIGPSATTPPATTSSATTPSATTGPPLLNGTVPAPASAPPVAAVPPTAPDPLAMAISTAPSTSSSAPRDARGPAAPVRAAAEQVAPVLVSVAKSPGRRAAPDDPPRST